LRAHARTAPHLAPASSKIDTADKLQEEICSEFSLRLLLLLLVLLSPAVALAQALANTAAIDPASENLHITKQTSPVYPPIAKAAHVSGQVKLKVEVGADGNVTASKLISGPQMLVGSAQECVKRWQFEPLLRDGAAVASSATVTVSFTLPPPANPNDSQIAERFFPLDRACIDAVSHGAATTIQDETCHKAADVAAEFSSQERFIERRGAFVYAATASLRNQQPKAALIYAEKAVAVVEQGHDDGSGSAAAYSVRAQAEAVSGDLAKASADLSKAEEYQGSAIAKMRSFSEGLVIHEYIPRLKGLLNFHAQVLSALGRPDEAAAKTAEAAKL